MWKKKKKTFISKEEKQAPELKAGMDKLTLLFSSNAVEFMIWTALIYKDANSWPLSVLVAQLRLTLCYPMDCSLPGSSVLGIYQARLLEWVAISFSRGSSQPRDQTWVSGIADRFLAIWATRQALKGTDKHQLLVFWLYNKKAWRTRILFLDWVNQCFVSEVRKYLAGKGLPFKVVLTLDNIPGHPELQLFNTEGIKVIQVPPNNTSLGQPLDQVVIRTFKAHYTQSSMERIVNTMEENSNREDIVKVWKYYTIEDDVIIEKAMKIIKPETINFCGSKLSRYCVWLHRIYDRAHQGKRLWMPHIQKKKGRW